MDSWQDAAFVISYGGYGLAMDKIFRVKIVPISAICNHCIGQGDVGGYEMFLHKARTVRYHLQAATKTIWTFRWSWPGNKYGPVRHYIVFTWIWISL